MAGAIRASRVALQFVPGRPPKRRRRGAAEVFCERMFSLCKLSACFWRAFLVRASSARRLASSAYGRVAGVDLRLLQGTCHLFLQDLFFKPLDLSPFYELRRRASREMDLVTLDAVEDSPCMFGNFVVLALILGVCRAPHPPSRPGEVADPRSCKFRSTISDFTDDQGALQPQIEAARIPARTARRSFRRGEGVTRWKPGDRVAASSCKTGWMEALTTSQGQGRSGRRHRRVCWPVRGLEGKPAWSNCPRHLRLREKRARL